MSQLVPIPSPGIPLLYGETGAPVVVVLHDSFGRLPWLEPYATALASRGFRVTVPDLSGGFCTTDAATADELHAGVTQAAATHLIEGAIAEASDGATTPTTAVVGFGSGGTLALRIVQAGRFTAAVSYYGTVPTDDRSIIPSTVLLHWADDDVIVPRDQADSLVAALRRDGTSVTEHRYLGTERGFANASIPATLNARAAALAFARTAVFLERHLTS